MSSVKEITAVLKSINSELEQSDRNATFVTFDTTISVMYAAMKIRVQGESGLEEKIIHLIIDPHRRILSTGYPKCNKGSISVGITSFDISYHTYKT